MGLPKQPRTSTSASSSAFSAGSDCQTRRLSAPSRAKALPEAQRAEPAVLVVHRGHAAGSRELDACAHRVDVLVVGRLDVAVAEVPARLLAQDAGRLAALVELDHAARDLQVAVRVRQGGGVEPDRVRVARHQRHRPVGGDRVERLLRRLGRRSPVAAAPTAAAQPGAAAKSPAPHARGRPPHRPSVVPSSRTSCWARAQVGKCTCESVKPGSDATAAEIHALRAGERGLVGADAAGDLVAGDRQLRASGSEGSIVRTTPFSRITRRSLVPLDRGKPNAG